MSYYKLIDGDAFVGVATDREFRRFQRKHKIILACAVEQAQYIQLGDIFYRANWMVPVITDTVTYNTVDVVRIERSEYDILYDAVETGEEVIPNPSHIQPAEDVAVIDQRDKVTVEYVRTTKIAKMRAACNQTIEMGVDVMLSDGKVHHFSLTTQDQLNLITLQSMVASGETMIPYHADGELCRYYTAEDISAVMDSATAHKTFQVTYYNSLKAYINSLEDIADIYDIQYGMDIPVLYQSDILKDLYASLGVDNNDEIC